MPLRRLQVGSLQDVEPLQPMFILQTAVRLWRDGRRRGEGNPGLETAKPFSRRYEPELADDLAEVAIALVDRSERDQSVSDNPDTVPGSLQPHRLPPIAAVWRLYRAKCRRAAASVSQTGGCGW